MSCPKSSEFAICLTNSGQKSLTMSITSYLNYINKKIKIEASGAIRTRNTSILRLRNTCAKKTPLKW